MPWDPACHPVTCSIEHACFPNQRVTSRHLLRCAAQGENSIISNQAASTSDALRTVLSRATPAGAQLELEVCSVLVVWVCAHPFRACHTYMNERVCARCVLFQPNNCNYLNDSPPLVPLTRSIEGAAQHDHVRHHMQYNAQYGNGVPVAQAGSGQPAAQKSSDFRLQPDARPNLLPSSSSLHAPMMHEVRNGPCSHAVLLDRPARTMHTHRLAPVLLI